MLFFVVIAVVIACVLIGLRDNYSPGISAFVLGLLSASVGSIVLFIFALTGVGNVTHGSQTTKLVALGSSSAISGRSYFLGGGYVQSYRTLNFIKVNSDGSNQLDDAYAANSYVYEDTPAENANVVTTDYWYSNGWIFPFEIGGKDTVYQFHVPADSVQSDFTVDNK